MRYTPPGEALRPPGTAQVPCAHSGCNYEFWVSSDNSGGPFFCPEHDPSMKRVDVPCKLCKEPVESLLDDESEKMLKEGILHLTTFCTPCLKNHLPDYQEGMPFSTRDEEALHRLFSTFTQN